MNENDLIKKLNSLLQLDIDAIRAYDQALRQIDDRLINFKMACFREDHVKHVMNLSHEITLLGGEPIELTPDFKGFFIEGFTALRSLTGTEGALKAMISNEHFTNKIYAEASQENLPPKIQQLIYKNYQDEQKHLTYIEKILADDSWKIQHDEKVKLEKSLNHILGYLHQSKDNYEEAADKIKNNNLYVVFKNLANERDAMISTLENEIIDLGFKPVNTSSFLGMGHTMYLSLKGLLTGGDPRTIIAEVKRSEDFMREQYNHALEHHLPTNTRELLEQQVRNIENYLYKIERLA